MATDQQLDIRVHGAQQTQWPVHGGLLPPHGGRGGAGIGPVHGSNNSGSVFTINGMVTEGDSRMQSNQPNVTPWMGLITRTTGLVGENVAESGTELTTMDSVDYAVQVAPLFSSSACNLAVIAGGFNDFWLGAKTPAQVHGYLQSWCAKARATGYKIAVMTVPTATIGGTWTSGKENDRIAYNALVRANYTAYADYLLDIDGLPAFSNPANATYYDVDGIHWFQPAQDAIAAYVKPILGLSNASLTAGTKFDSAATAADITIAGDGRTIYKNTVNSFVSSKVTLASSGGIKSFEILLDSAGPGSIMIGIGNASVLTSAYAGSNTNGISWWSNDDSWLGGVGSAGIGAAPRNGDRFQFEYNAVAQTVRIRKRRLTTWGAWSATQSTSGLAAGPYYPWVMLDRYAQVTANFTNWS